MSMQKNFLSVVNKAQNREFCHKKLLKSIENSFDINELDAFLNVYSKALFHLYCSEYANKNPFVARGLEFLAKLAIDITLKCVKPLDVTNPNGTVSQVYDITSDQFFNNLLKCSLKFTLVEKSEVRFNTCYFITVLLQNIGNNVEMDYSLCNTILESLVELLDDPKVNVRLQALKALVRLQEPGNPECVVLNSFLVLFADPNSEVRKAVISLVAPHPQSFAKIRERLNDIDINVRQAAYTKWADTNPKLYLKIVDRNFILTCGFADNYKKINQIVTEKLLPKWLTAYQGNYLDLLKALKLDADENDIKNFEDLCSNVMDVFLKAHSFSDVVKCLPINKKDKVVPVDLIHLESALYWSILVSYLRNRDDSDDYLQDILPELTAFSNYIERVIKEKSATAMDEWENLEYQNIILQLFKMASGYDMSDEVGRKTFYNLILQILSTYKFQQKVITIIINVAAQLNQNICTLTTDMCQVISEIREPLIDDIPSEETLRARNFQMSQLKVKIHNLEIAEEDALKIKDFQHANIVHNELKECQRQFEVLTNTFSQSEKVRTSKDDPETICRCLDILIGLLQTPSIIKMSEALLTCKDEFLMPLMNNNISDIHWRFILCLGLFSVIDKDIAFQHANFMCLPIATYRAIPNYDKKALKISVACVTDLIRVYGVNVIGIEDANALMNQTTNRRKLYSEDMNELTAVNKEDINIEFIIDIIVDMLDDENEDVRNTAAKAISRLMLYNFPVNPELITRLILKWYNPLTVKKDVKLQQQVGFIITCFADHVEGSRRIVEKAVLPIIYNLVNAPRNSPLVEVDIDNVLKFLSALTTISKANETENIHRSLARSIIEKISNKPNDACTPYFAKLLTYLDVGSDDSESLKNMISSIEFVLPDILDKAPHKNLVKFMNQLKMNSTSILEESEQAVDESRSISKTAIQNRTEGNAEETSVNQDDGELKSCRKSPCTSRVSNENEKAQEVPKRNSNLHEIEGNFNEIEANTAKKNRKDNSSEQEEGTFKADDELSAQKNCKKSPFSNGISKKLSLMKHRRDSSRGGKKLPKIPEESTLDKFSKKSVVEKKCRVKKSKKIKEEDTKSSSKKSCIKKSIGKNIESSSDKGCSGFVNCDNTTSNNGVKNGLNLNSPKSMPHNASDNGNVNLEGQKDFPKKITRHLSKSQKVKIISQFVLQSSGTNINNSDTKSLENKSAISSKNEITKHSVDNSINKKNIARRLNNSAASSKSLVEKNVEQLQNTPSTDQKTPRKALLQRSTKQLSKTYSNIQIRSPVILLTPLKSRDCDTMSIQKHNGQGGSPQSSPDKTSLKKRVAKTPLSALGNRLSKKSSSATVTRSAPTKSFMENSSLPRTSSDTVHSERRDLRYSARKKNDYSAATPVRKRRSTTPNSLLKQKPNKIAKMNNCVDENKKEIKAANPISKTGNKNEKNEKRNNENTKTPAVISKPKYINDKNQSKNKSQGLRPQRIVSTEMKRNLRSPNKEKVSNLKKDNTKSNNTPKKKKELPVPVSMKKDINKEKNNSNKLPRKILRRSGRIEDKTLNEKEKPRGKKGENQYTSSDDDNCTKLSAKSDINCLKDISRDALKINSSLKSPRVLLNSDLNAKISTKVLKNVNSAVKESTSDPGVTGVGSKKNKKSKNAGVDIVNQSLKSCNRSNFNGNLSIERSPLSPPFTSTVTTQYVIFNNFSNRIQKEKRTKYHKR
ncbi:hypothetical protein WA026_000397 [Henosepilachna vigintioctopunctata]|uniref:Nuclear condensin complex subunit 3 C-terminal domain-containing protein n=1 Tax=Henosepilachna vigintioctopunctata TaxID=420089 RepID=A0AAW1V513_9CUCU